MTFWDWLWQGHTDWQWWQAGLYILSWSVAGAGLGRVLAKAYRRRHPFNVRYVRPRCLARGHKWERIPGVPIQFCRRYNCMGARVAPFMFEMIEESGYRYPTDLLAELEQSLDRNAALSLDRRP